MKLKLNFNVPLKASLMSEWSRLDCKWTIAPHKHQVKSVLFL